MLIADRNIWIITIVLAHREFKLACLCFIMIDSIVELLDKFIVSKISILEDNSKLTNL